MCVCNPIVRTPWCGKPGCEWPGSKLADQLPAATRRSSLQTTPDDRYHSDPMFRQLVDLMEHYIRLAQFTPSELREAAILGATHYELRRTSRPMYLPDDKPGEKG